MCRLAAATASSNPNLDEANAKAREAAAMAKRLTEKAKVGAGGRGWEGGGRGCVADGMQVQCSCLAVKC